MPGNTIKINNYDGLEWYIGDSKMEELIEWLKVNGEKTKSILVKQLSINDFDRWLEDLVFPREVDDFIEVLYDGGESEGDGHFEMKKR